DRVDVGLTVDADERAGNMTDAPLPRESQQQRAPRRRNRTLYKLVRHRRISRVSHGNGLAERVHFQKGIVIDHLPQLGGASASPAALAHPYFLIGDKGGCR